MTDMPKLTADLAATCRRHLKLRADARPQAVRYRQGDHDCLHRELPMMLATAFARSITLEGRISELEAKLAKLEAAAPAHEAADVVDLAKRGRRLKAEIA